MLAFPPEEGVRITRVLGAHTGIGDNQSNGVSDIDAWNTAYS
jgi:hypothetical protein